MRVSWLDPVQEAEDAVPQKPIVIVLKMEYIRCLRG
jgi:hypothetical protein